MTERLALPNLEIPDLAAELAALVGQIPYGRVATCGTLARALGNPVAARWVGHFLLHHEHNADCGCHRVVRAEGVVASYIDGGPAAKARRLAAEGVGFQEGAVDLAQYGFDAFRSSRPLTALMDLQNATRAGVKLARRRRMPRLVGGVDVSYVRRDEGVAAYAMVDVESGALVWSMTLRQPIRFPYVTSYLTFRELPILVALLEEVRAADRLAEALMVDGSGILHPRGAGIAAHLGVVLNWPTIGVTKKLLCGQVDWNDLGPLQSRPVLHEDRIAGVAVRPTAGSRRPIFVSPGHRVDVTFSETLTRSLLVGHRLPEPLYWADRLSRRHAKNCDK